MVRMALVLCQKLEEGEPRGCALPFLTGIRRTSLSVLRKGLRKSQERGRTVMPISSR